MRGIPAQKVKQAVSKMSSQTRYVLKRGVRAQKAKQAAFFYLVPEESFDAMVSCIQKTKEGNRSESLKARKTGQSGTAVLTVCPRAAALFSQAD